MAALIFGGKVRGRSRSFLRTTFNFICERLGTTPSSSKRTVPTFAAVVGTDCDVLFAIFVLSKPFAGGSGLPVKEFDGSVF